MVRILAVQQLPQLRLSPNTNHWAQHHPPVAVVLLIRPSVPLLDRLAPELDALGVVSLLSLHNNRVPESQSSSSDSSNLQSFLETGARLGTIIPDEDKRRTDGRFNSSHVLQTLDNCTLLYRFWYAGSLKLREIQLETDTINSHSETFSCSQLLRFPCAGKRKSISITNGLRLCAYSNPSPTASCIFKRDITKGSQ
ncbi:hypothetical protein VTL71DRAFT_3548 [Oculimacula yallundae]|uniref:Uncharacterized protein n=1 Tax=Oculimacula yallundae TaxID=86028 RepID=A0ABR4C7I1_9HELO